MPRLVAIALALGFTLACGQASAQTYQRPPTSPNQTPPVSPYLNLLRGGNPAVNYYDLVRPQQDTRSALLSLQQQQNRLASQPASVQSGLFITGHPARFMNYSSYYYNDIGFRTPVSGIRTAAGVPAPLPYGGGYPGASPYGFGGYGAGLTTFSFVTGTGIVRP